LHGLPAQIAVIPRRRRAAIIPWYALQASDCNAAPQGEEQDA
jgi:hypothetical protein